MEGRRVLPILACVLLAFLAAGTPLASAHIIVLDSSVAETVVIPAGEFHAYTLRLSAGDEVWIQAASAGDPIDVYSMDYASFKAYAGGSDTYAALSPGSREIVTEFSEVFRAPATDRYYFVFDNAPQGGTGAVPAGDVQVALSVGRVLPTTDANWGGMAVLGAAAAGWVAFLVLAWRRRADPRTGWQRRSWWQKPSPHAAPVEGPVYNAFSDR